ncbi:alpha-L-glutamate ligase [Halobacteriales archaeon QH_7_66_37]|nr:MAG: alpha-L-glutamate ligase [Halobacteriales archaeon QH_7_66_37]
MLRLAVATNAETYERMQTPLADRGIGAEVIETAERSIHVTGGDANGAGQFGDSFDVGFVFPPRLAEGGVADALLDVPWVNDRECVLRSRQKGETLARLSRAGLPTPETVVVSNPADEAVLKDVFAEFEPPVVVKPNATTRGTGVALAEDLDSFLGICDYLDLVHDYRATGDQSFLVQEFLPDARDFRVMLIDGEVGGAVERRLPEEALSAGQWKHNVHRGAAATGVDLDEELGEKARRIVEAAAEALEIPWLGVDLLVTDDRIVVNETNARPTIDEATKYEPGFWDDLASSIRMQV